MKSKKFLILAIILLSGMSFHGCLVFDWVGSSLGQFYENTVSYFNAFYNASRLLSEVEAEINEPTRARKIDPDVTSVQQIQLTAASRQKLNLVIDKCSNILAFHPNSNMVDDALFLTGKSYFYLGDYAKSERKFTEILSQYPDSPLGMESQLWLVRSLYLLNNFESANQFAEELIKRATAKGEKKIVGKTHIYVGEHHSSQGDYDAAVNHFLRGIEFSSENEEKAVIQLRIANLILSRGEDERAIEAYERVSNFSSQPFYLAQTGLQLIRTYRKVGKLQNSLLKSNSLLRDFRVLDYTKEIQFERAKTLEALGQYDEALETYIVLDTTSAQTEIGGKAAFASAELYENHFFDYRRAAKAYARTGQNTLTDLNARARQREQSILKYFRYSQAWGINDSLLLLPDTLFMKPDSIHTQPDSLFSLADSLSVNRRVDSTFQRFVVINKDSLRKEQLALTFEFGELFYSELEKPDSALFWFKYYLDEATDSTKTPRAIFVIAELFSDDSLSLDKSARNLYQQLVDEYPNSTYSTIARRKLGISLPISDEDPAGDFYVLAEKKLDEGKYREAIKSFNDILRQWPGSPLAPKSAYAVGWIYENKLNMPDSAISHYRRLIENYQTSTFAQKARPRIGMAEIEISTPTPGTSPNQPQIDDVEIDSAPKKKSPLEEETPANRRGQAVEQKKIIKD